ncbi:protein mono-ADP-ribosyltransferase PARP12-like [Hoplias malabaricus]|uniref:protein mono-ADP-ribosyltransferase PARP12-like n=1 Tax=Hoplias malabaricus TaxID=27720 RepID=UPI00346227AA
MARLEKDFSGLMARMSECRLELEPGRGSPPLLSAVTPLRVCGKSESDCGDCGQLHICRYLVCGNCKFGSKCKNSHDLKSPHNSSLLRKNNLHGLRDTQLFQLLLQNDPSLLPEVCSHYNKGNGEHGSCKYETSCTSLHLCLHFLQDDCKFGAACKRAHSLDSTAMKMLNGRGFSQENIHNLHKIYKNKFLLAGKNDKPAPKGPEKVSKQAKRLHSSNSVSEADRNEICLFFVRKGCSFKEKCVRVHHNLPYKWELLAKDGVTWMPLPYEEHTEKAYCNPANDMSSGPQPVNFDKMTCGGSAVRRLSTASSVTKPPHFVLTTEWLWYWKNEQGSWTEYGYGDDALNVSPLNSKALENLYLAEIETEIPFSVGNHDYVLNLKDMYQQNLRYKTVRQVRRRPRFVSAQDVKSKLKSDSQANSSSSEDVPAHWDTCTPGFTYQIINLSNTAPEYKRVSLLFKHTMPTSTIHNIRRVQNPSLWKVFQWQKQQMKERNGGSEVDERYLFHGTDQSLIEAICEHNFDWRVCGVHGTLYGKGSYFARDAKYSDRYAKSRGNSKTIFVALVLVGEFIKGNSSYVRPPQKKSKKAFYDSCVDNEANPAIFVVFEKYQIYPEYIIDYT